MSCPKHRIKAPGAYFVTAETWQRRKLFLNEACTQIFLETILQNRERGFYLLHDFVIMPDHFHLILTPGFETSHEKALQMIKGGSSHRIGKELRMEYPVWQPDFHEHWIRSMVDYERCKAYVERNPVAAGLVAAPHEYPFSSACGRFQLDEYHMASGAKAPDP
jgi:putative transposase